MVRLLASAFVTPTAVSISFNSNMVRLLAAVIVGRKVAVGTFQFQYGAITGGYENQDKNPNTCFNSNMVRLLDIVLADGDGYAWEFQFQYGAITGRERIIN